MSVAKLVNISEDQLRCLERLKEYGVPECVESQEWTYGIDNTGTNFRWPAATYKLTLSNGQTLEWQQTTASNGSWSAQLEEWALTVQAAADAAGYQWLVEPRFVDSANPQDLSGIDTLAGPPSAPVGQALFDGGMRWRYLNIQICPGQPVPTGGCLVSVEDSGGFAVPALPRNLTAAGAVLGPIKKFIRCIKCDDEGGSVKWYNEGSDGALTPAAAGEIPFCWEPCGTLALTSPPPDQECFTTITDGCDNNGETDPTLFTQGIQRHTQICGGEIAAIVYYQPDPADATALVDYSLNGQFVDCASGAVIEEDLPPPKTYLHVGTLYKFVEQAESVQVEYWQPAANGGSAVPHDDVTAIFGSGLNAHPNAPDVTFTMTSLNVSTSSAAFLSAAGYSSNTETSGTDQMRITFWTCGAGAGELIDSNGNTGERGAALVNGVLAIEDTTDSVGGDLAAIPPLMLCSGVNKVVIATSDFSAWQGYQPSGDGLSFYADQPQWQPVQVFKCADLSGGYVDCDRNPIEVTDKDFWNNPPASNCASPSSGGSTVEPVALQTVRIV